MRHIADVITEALNADLGDIPVTTFHEVASSQLRKGILKKYQDDPVPGFEREAFLKFTSVNTKVGSWELTPNTSGDEELIGNCKRFIDDFLHPFGLPLVGHWFDLLDSARVGPGASIMSRGFDIYAKLFGGPLSVTDLHLYSMYRHYLKRQPRWAEAEEYRQRLGFGVEVVDANRLSFVPKDRTIARTICTEPSLNMFFQLGLGTILVKRLKAFGIDLECQQRYNQRLACVGSIDDCYSTIDLSSASDSLSWQACKFLFPRWFLDYLEALRVKASITPYGRVELNMVSTMGNGFTFPLQTLVFLSFVNSAMVSTSNRMTFSDGSYLGNFGVNGDDIVCLTGTVTQRVLRLLTLFGFEVNREKTFTEGTFRESCGRDYYRGRDVRAVYIKTLQTQQDRYSVINQLVNWSAKTGIPLPRTCRSLLRTVRPLFVPPAEDYASGIHVPESYIRARYKHGLASYWAFRPNPLSYRILDSGFKGHFDRRLGFNPAGLEMAGLYGAVNNHKISVRNLRGVKWKTKRFVTPFWDYQANRFQGRLSWQRWETAVYSNLK